MVTLTVNDREITLNAFSANLIESTLKGALSTLHGGENLVAALVRVEGGTTTRLTLNGAPAEMNEFVNGFLARVVGGAAAALRDTGEIETVEVRIT